MSDYQFNPNVEQWKDIPNYPGYEVSDHGRIRSFWTIGHHILKNTSNIKKARFSADRRYLRVILSKNGEQFSEHIHRLVLLAFIGPCPPKHMCCHNNGDGTYNFLNNLRWDTSKSNCKDKHQHGTAQVGEKGSKVKLTNYYVKKIRYIYSKGYYNQRQIAKRFGVCQSTIWNIVNRKQWTHI